jgi:sugar lactone lactonase YvrE
MRTATLTLALFAATTLTAAAQANILIGDEKSSPESLTVAADGQILVGSATTPFVYRAKPTTSAAEKFVDASSEPAGTIFLGMLADDANHTLWTCELTPVPDSQPKRRTSAVRSFDIATGTPKLRWNLPGDSSTCNDLSIGPDKALYITDTPNARIYRLPHGATEATLYTENSLLKGIDGLAFVGKVLYVNNVSTNKLYRIPVDASGKAQDPVEIQTDKVLEGPDGMRAAKGKLYVAENRGGKVSVVVISGDKGTVTVLKDGLKTPTAIEPHGNTLWFSERAIGKVESLPLSK